MSTSGKSALKQADFARVSIIEVFFDEFFAHFKAFISHVPIPLGKHLFYHIFTEYRNEGLRIFHILRRYLIL